MRAGAALILPVPPAVGGSSRATSGCLPSALTGSWQDTVVPQRLAGSDRDQSPELTLG
jgi:hypothetical protein